MKQANVNTNSKVAATYNDELERLLFECGALERQNIMLVTDYTLLKEDLNRTRVQKRILLEKLQQTISHTDTMTVNNSDCQ